MGRPPSRRSRGEDPPVRSLDRGLALLLALGDARSSSLTELGDALHLPYSTVHRLLATLARRGFVEHETASGKYRVGPAAVAIGAGYRRSGVSEAAHEVMIVLRDQLDETVNLAVRDGAAAIYVHQVEGRRRVRMFTRVGASVALHCTGVGKALLAWEEESALEELLSELVLEPQTEHTLATTDALRRDLLSIASRGYALDLEEYEVGVRCVAAPLFDARSMVAAAMSVSAPLTRFDDERMVEVADALRAAADEASRRLGWQGPEERARQRDQASVPVT